jgi:hypothetical protein
LDACDDLLTVEIRNLGEDTDVARPARAACFLLLNLNKKMAKPRLYESRAAFSNEL